MTDVRLAWASSSGGPDVRLAVSGKNTGDESVRRLDGAFDERKERIP